MILEQDGWRLRIYEVATRRYSTREAADHCACGWCRNFYAAVDQTYPDLRHFLAKLGAHVEAPEEMIAFSPTLCTAYYAVCGEILERGQGSLQVGNLALWPQTETEAMVRTECPEPVIFLCTDCMTLPWVLREPMEDADSPAKGSNPIFRLLSRYIKL